MITLVLSEEWVSAVLDVPPRRDGLLWPAMLANITLPGFSQLYKQLVVDAGAADMNAMKGTAAQ